MRGVQSKTRIVLFYHYWVSCSLAEGVSAKPVVTDVRRDSLTF
jgi:hypothetical protein